MFLLRYQGIVMSASRNDDLLVTELEMPTTEIRENSTFRFGSDGAASGPEWLGEAFWTWTVTTNVRSLPVAMALSGQLEAAWKDPAVRSSHSHVPLEYSHDNGATWYRVYGRPGRFTPLTPDYRAMSGVGAMVLEFVQRDPLHYASEESFTRIGVNQASTGTAWRFPLRFPLSGVASGEPRAGLIVNRGDRPAPVRAVFKGPGSNFRLWGEGFEAGYKGALAHDQTLTLDGVERTSIRRTGGSRVRHVTPTRKTRLTQLHLPPGTSNLWFETTDPTGVSHVDIYWRAAYTSMQGGLHV